MSTMKALIAATALLLALAGGVLAQPGPYGGMGGTQVRISSWSDRGAYYVQVDHRGAEPEVLTRIRGRRLEVAVREEVRGPRGFMTGGSTKRIALPMDADVTRMERREAAGRLLLVIPRRPDMWRRW